MPNICTPKRVDLCYGELYSVMPLSAQALTSITSFASPEPEPLPKPCGAALPAVATLITSAAREPALLPMPFTVFLPLTAVISYDVVRPMIAFG